MTSRKEIQSAIDKLDLKAAEDIKETLHELMTKGMEAGMSPKDMLNISDEVLETVYSHAYNLYNRGKYSESSYIFRLLIMLDYTQAKFQMGLGACLHMLKEYESAMQVYMLTGTLNAGNPLPYFHAADCCLQMGSPTGATYMLELAVREAGGKPEYAVLVERCHLMMESLEEGVNEELMEHRPKWDEIRKNLRNAEEQAEGAKQEGAKKPKGK